MTHVSDDNVQSWKRALGTQLWNHLNLVYCVYTLYLEFDMHNTSYWSE